MKIDSLDPVLAGTGVDYEIAAFNNGPANATGVVVSDPLPAGVIFDSASSIPFGSCSEALGTVTCAIGSLAKNEVVRIQIRANVPVAALGLSNTASVAGDQMYPNPANNIATATTQVTLPEPTLPLLAGTALATLLGLARRRRR